MTKERAQEILAAAILIEDEIVKLDVNGQGPGVSYKRLKTVRDIAFQAKVIKNLVYQDAE